MHYLFLTRHYPPEISGGARRPYLLVRALRNMGHRITLVTPFKLDDPDHIFVPSPVRMSNMPDQDMKPLLRVEHASTNPKVDFIIRAFLRQWLLWPEPEIRWAKRVERAILAQGIRPDAILTTSPPESLHVVGSRLARKLRVKWVADFRDTWFLHPHREILAHSKLRQLVERKIARRALEHASALTAVSKTVMQDVLSFAPKEIPRQIIGHFSSSPTATCTLPKDDINLVHSGGFSLSDRGRKLPVLLHLVEQASCKRPELHLHIFGKLSTDEINEIDRSSARVTHHGQVPLEKAQAMQVAADGLILFTPQRSHALPGKYAEYCLAGRPILIHGGGEWLNQIKDKQNLRPLVEGMLSLQKQESVTNRIILSDQDAAKLFAKILDPALI